jgi:ribosomal-protein-alanine N-acetyltransferase
MLRIRLARHEDLDFLLALDQACFRVGIAYPRAELAHFLFHPRSISVVAQDETAIAGFAIVELTADKSGRRVGHVITIDVDPARRREGVGRVLMDALLNACRRAGAVLVRLEVAVDNDGAIAFYTLMGFKETRRVRNFYIGTLDALRMEMALAGEAGG